MKPSAGVLLRHGGSDVARGSAAGRRTRGILGHDRLTERNKLFVGGGAYRLRRALSALHSSLWTSPGGVTIVDERPSLPGSSMSGGVLIRTASCSAISPPSQCICRSPCLLRQESCSLLRSRLVFRKPHSSPVACAETYQSSNLFQAWPAWAVEFSRAETPLTRPSCYSPTPLTLFCSTMTAQTTASTSSMTPCS